LEFAPVYHETLTADGNLITTMRFEPQRNKLNPLPRELTTVFLEESSMIGTDLYQLFIDAIPEGHQVQLIFLGDINQLSPVFGDAILGYKLLELPTIVLTQVYRQALESPIIRLAHRILSGKQILYPELSKDEANGGLWQVKDKLQILNWKPKTSDATAEVTTIAYLKREYLAGRYNPFEDMVICPFNKAFGTINLSKGIAKFMDEKNGIHPQEIISGYFKKYHAVGDLVLYRNDEYIITKITRNGDYTGKLQPDTTHLFDRFGNIVGKTTADKSDVRTHKKTPDEIINAIVALAEGEVTDSCSHILYLTKPEGIELYSSKGLPIPDDLSIQLDSRGQVNNLLLSYATTCHKAQGLESRKVFIILHKSHGILTNREWLYTAITRAKESLTILCERDTFIGGINKQQIKGTTLEEKAEYFKGKQLNKTTLVNS
jgi:ATP-dependent exoDNAse (exonuclease V) alpha subunit